VLSIVLMLITSAGYWLKPIVNGLALAGQVGGAKRGQHRVVARLTPNPRASFAGRFLVGLSDSHARAQVDVDRYQPAHIRMVDVDDSVLS